MKYKIILLGILLLLASFGFAITITTCQGLQEINQNLNGTYILGNDIDCSQTNTWNSGAGFQPIGSWGPWFTGVFDGAGYTISGLYINRPTTDDVGLFGCTYSTAIIQNINLQDANIIGRSNVGSIIGTATGSVSNLSASFDSIQGTGSYIGGLVGRIYGISPSTLYEFNNLTININSIQGGSYVGGIIGGMANWSTGGVEFTNLSSTITNGLYSTSSYNGGLIGGALSQKTNLRNSTADINYIYNKGSGSYIGGLIGKTDGNIYDSNSTITLIGLERTAHYDSVTGGLAGQANHIENSWSQTNINATLGPTFSGAYIGGLAGIANTINNSHSKGNYITANKGYGDSIGGLAGTTNGPINDSNATFNQINGNNNVGGLIGKHSATNPNNHLKNLYADTNNITSNSYTGGLIGQIYGSGKIDFNDSNAKTNTINGGDNTGGLLGGMYNFASNNNVGINFNNLTATVNNKINATGGYTGGLIGSIISIGSTIRNSTADINYIYNKGSGSYIGGLIGKTDGNIYNSYIPHSQIDLERTAYYDSVTGGLAGQANHIENSWSQTNINATLGPTFSGAYIGGLAGIANTINNSHSKGNYITANKGYGDSIGGLAGTTNGPINDSNATFNQINGNNNVGGLIGKHSATNPNNHLKNLYADTNNITSNSYTGGLIGQIYGYNGLSDFNDSNAKTNTINGGDNTGGLLGGMYNFASNNNVGINFNNLTATVNNKINATGGYTGGLIGSIISIGSTIRNSTADINYIYNKGSGSYIGGLIGKTDGNIYNSYIPHSQIDLERTAYYDSVTGGLAGQANHIENSWSQTNINATLGPTFSGAYIGGLAGIANTINNSHSKGNYITANKGYGDSIGGLAGTTNGPINDSNATFNQINGNNNVGGLIGKHSATNPNNHLKNLYADTNNITSNSYTGGLIGQIYGSGKIDFNDSNAKTNTINGGDNTGGLLGGMYNFASNNNVGINFNNLTATVNNKINATGGYTGGLIGSIISIGSTIRNSTADINYIYNKGSGSYIGGLIGKTDGNIYNSYIPHSQIDLERTAYYDSVTGGLAGQANHIENSWSQTNINATLGPTFSGAYIGGLAGIANTINNSHSKGNYITANKGYGDSIGGLAGTTNGPINDSNATFNQINGNNNVGGLIGKHSATNPNNHLKNLYADTNNITSNSYTGGLIGQIYGSGKIDFNDSNAKTNTINGGDNTGGLLGGMYNFASNNNVGINFNNLTATVNNKINATGGYTGGLIGSIISIGSTIRNSTADINYIYNKGSGSYIGGLIGKTDGNIYNSYIPHSQIDLERTAYYDSVTGGLAGQANHIENSWSQTNINATLGPTFSGAYIGGLAGIANTINNSYSKGNYITANKSNGYYIGGLVGKLSAGSITNSYSSIQTIDAGTNYYIGGLVGEGSNITNSFSITDVTGGSNSGPFCGYTCNSITNSYYLNGNDVTLYGGNNISSEGSTYFKGTSIVEPFTNWNFYNSQSKPTGDWFVWTNDYPHLSLSPIINYYTNGTFISKKMNLSAPKKFTTMDLNMNKPTDTNIEIQIRTATSEIGLDIAPWLGPDGTNETNYLVDGETINSIHDKNSWVQYKATLTTTNTSVTPTLYDINIHTIAIGEVIYAKLNSGFTWLSFNQSNDLNGCTVNWYYSLNNSPYAWESTSETLTGSDNLWIKAIINGTIDSNNLRIENISINYAE